MSASAWSWYELLTSDPVAATAFYSSLIGWTSEPWPDPAMAYTIVSAPSGSVGGVMAQDPGKGGPPAWTGVVEVPDADAAVARCRELGGAVLDGPFDIPNVGRYAVLADPTGAVFSIMKSATAPEGPPPDKNALGRVSWHELWSSDPDAAWAFYAAMFGWVETGKMDMGPSGIYRMYGVSAEGGSLGGIMRRMPEQPVSAWCFYFNTPDAAASAASVRALGGTVIFGPHEVPGGGKMVMAMDPQGAVFATYTHGS